jgi:hypothetical protein
VLARDHQIAELVPTARRLRAAALFVVLIPRTAQQPEGPHEQRSSPQPSARGGCRRPACASPCRAQAYLAKIREGLRGGKTLEQLGQELGFVEETPELLRERLAEARRREAAAQRSTDTA